MAKPITPMPGFNIRRALTSAGITFCCVCESLEGKRRKNGNTYCEPCVDACAVGVGGVARVSHVRGHVAT